MANTPSNTIHWILYPVLGAALLFTGWLWHNTQVHDAAMLQAVATAKADQAAIDKQAASNDKAALDTLQKQNTDLNNQLASAKTTLQQIALINKQAGTNLQPAPPTATTPPPGPNPSQQPLPDAPKPAATLSAEDIEKLAQQSVKYQEAENQVGADQIELQGKDQQIAARDKTIDSQNAEITALKGGSHLKRFLKAAKYVAIGVAVGVAVDEVAKAK